MTLMIANAATTCRRPRRAGGYRRQFAALEEMLAELDGLDRQAPLSEKFVARLRAMHERARRPLARVGPGLAVEAIGPDPVPPGAALVVLLKLRLVLARALATRGEG